MSLVVNLSALGSAGFIIQGDAPGDRRGAPSHRRETSTATASPTSGGGSGILEASLIADALPLETKQLV